MTKEHTPTPWYNIANDIYYGSEYGTAPIASVCGECSFTQDQANAAHIVKCVNMHDELVEALEPIAKMEIILDNPSDDDVCFVSYGTIKKIQETLKKAGAL